MRFGHVVATACSSFAVTNIDDIFVLVTFFAEASSPASSLTPLKIMLGQYLGFSIIIIISMIGYGASFLFASEPIGFLGLLPISLGFWNILGLVFDRGEDGDGVGKFGRMSAVGVVVKVASVTLMNGGDNIGTYIPLFSQAKGSEIAVYVLVYYFLLGVWILAAWLIMKQRHVLRIAERYAKRVVPFLYIGLGIFIIVNSDCYPWSIKQINDDIEDGSAVKDPGRIIMAVITTFLLLMALTGMVALKVKKRKALQRARRASGNVEDGDELDDNDCTANNETITATTDTMSEATTERRENTSPSNNGVPETSGTKRPSRSPER